MRSAERAVEYPQGAGSTDVLTTFLTRSLRGRKDRSEKVGFRSRLISAAQAPEAT